MEGVGSAGGVPEGGGADRRWRAAYRPRARPRDPGALAIALRWIARRKEAL
jgi:hypothetical protein